MTDKRHGLDDALPSHHKLTVRWRQWQDDARPVQGWDERASMAVVVGGMGDKGAAVIAGGGEEDVIDYYCRIFSSTSQNRIKKKTTKGDHQATLKVIQRGMTIAKY